VKEAKCTYRLVAAFLRKYYTDNAARRKRMKEESVKNELMEDFYEFRKKFAVFKTSKRKYDTGGFG